MKTFLTLFVLLFSSSVVAEDISDFQIEGMSVGDSLLDYMTEETIKTEIARTRYMYTYLTEEFAQVFLYKNFETYDVLSFFVKTNDKNFIIYAVSASISYDNDINGCYLKQKEIIDEFSSLFNYTKKIEETAPYPLDPTGITNNRYTIFILESGDEIKVSCKKFEKNLKIKNNWKDNLGVKIQKKEVSNWITNY